MTVLLGVLLLAGVAEIVAMALRLIVEGDSGVAAASSPGALLPFAFAVVLSLLGGRVHRIAALIGAGVALIVRCAVASLLVAPGWHTDLAGAFDVVSGLLTGLVVFVFALLVVRGQMSVTREDSAVSAIAPPRLPAPESPNASRPVSPLPLSPTEQREPGAVSPATPVDLSLKKRHSARSGAWATASTPWPRADEDDPNGTVIRPPRR